MGGLLSCYVRFRGYSGRVVARLLCKVARVFWESCQGVHGGC